MYRIGIDLGGTNIAGGLVNENYEIVHKESVPTNAAERTQEEIVGAIAELCQKICDAKGIALAEVEAIGVASPGIADHDRGVVVYSNNLPFRDLPVASMLCELTGVSEVHVENDANAAAWGEAVAGAARGTKKSVMITLGTGVGGGVIIDGKVISGFNYAGGELGHTVIEKNGAPCSCGRRGCWEAYSSATALIRMTGEKIEECARTGRKTVMTDLVEAKGKISGRTAFDAMRAGDEAGQEVVDTYISYLATGIANMVNIFQPEVLSIGGGVSNEKENLLRPLEPLVRKEQYGSGLVPMTRICVAELGNDAGIIGAAFLGMN
ncbi:MAG: ROK family protein [Ruminococcaceae bacterium]|nr:ROK family protein [Oscillospiraceae bacterium]